MKKKTKQSLIALLVLAVFIALDQWTKALAVSKLKGKESFVLIKDVFEFRYLENIGAAFSSMEGKTWWLIGVTSVLIVVCVWLYTRMPETKKWFLVRAILVCIIAGGIGNLIDRIRLHYVVDFIYFKLIDFPTFNVADCYVTVAVFVLLFAILLGYKEEDWNEVSANFPTWMRSKKKVENKEDKEEVEEKIKEENEVDSKEDTENTIEETKEEDSEK